MRMLVIAAALVGAVVVCSAPAYAAAFQPTQVDMSDVVVGLGAPGPYALSWNNIAPASEQVEVNGVPLLRGVDYTVDWVKGTITFARPLAANSAAYVTYLRQPGQSQVNQPPVDLPAAIPLGEFAGTNVALALRYQQQPADGPRGVYGIRAGHGGATKIDAGLFFSDTGGSGKGESAGRAYGWRIGAQRNYSQLDLAASFARADRGFNAPHDLPASAGLETMNLAANYRPARNVTAKASLTSAQDIVNPDHPTTQTREYGLTAAPMRGANVSLGHTEVQGQAGSGSTATTTDSVQTSLSLGSATAAAAYGRSVAGESRSDTESLRLASTLGRGLNLSASHSEARSDTIDQRGSEVALDVAASRQARLRAVTGTRRGDEFVDYHGVEATLKPMDQLTFGGAYKERDYRDHQLDTRVASIAVSPLKRVEIGGEYARNPEDAQGNVQQATSTKVRLATQLGILGLSGSVARQIAVAGDEQRAGEVRLSLTIASAHKLYTGYRQSEIIPLSGVATAATETYLLGYDYAVGSDFSLSLEGQLEQSRDSQQFHTDTQQSANAKLNWRF
jgi:hypothetical protein